MHIYNFIGARVYEAITQTQFLLSMGIIERLEKLIESPTVSDQDAQVIIDSLQKIIDPEGMGKRFKVMCISDQQTTVFGFSSDLESKPVD